MSDLNKLPRKKILEWITKFDKAIANETNEENIQLFKKLKEEAVEELNARDMRRENYLRCKEKGLFN